MTDLFTRGYLRDYMEGRVQNVISDLNRMSEDEVLHRSIDDLARDLRDRAYIEPLIVSDEPIDGGVTEGTVEVQDSFDRYAGTILRPVFHVHAVYEFSGNPDLLHYTPSTSIAFVRIRADVDTRKMVLTVRTAVSAQGQLDPAEVRRAYEEEIGRIRTNAGHAAEDVDAFNSRIEARIRPVIERRKQHLQSRRDLSGALGFPLQKRRDAPRAVPMSRKPIGTARDTLRPRAREPYRDEPALTEAQYEDAIGVVKSALLAMERSPSVVGHKNEEEIRDLILVQLNGTFKGNATGETFVKSGKTDLLVRVEDRHVFVGECKWWKGKKAFGNAIDQLLGYLPWRDEKAALILFISQKDASAVIETADKAIRAHAAFKRNGAASADSNLRRNYILGHPDDPQREIQTAVLFAVFSADENCS